MKILTISIAAYNVEKYIDKTIMSIVSTSMLEDVEVLIVNDGSKDDTLSKAYHYQNLYPGAIRVIDKENGGHGSTINKGIEEARGKYFRALDGDDWIQPDNLSRLIKKIKQIDSDIILSNYCMCYEDGKEETGNDFELLEDEREYSFTEIANLVDWMRYHTVIYRTEILKSNNIRLDENCFYVDTEFMLFPIPYVDTIYYSENYIYCYRLGLSEQSVSPQSRIKHISNGKKVTESIINCYNENKDNLPPSKQKYFKRGILNHCIWHHQSLCLFKPGKETIMQIKEYDRYLNENAPEIYEEMSKRSKTINILRATNYLAYKYVYLYKRHHQ